jgi:endoglucanase
MTPALRRRHEQTLLRLTSLPTAAGHEDRPLQWVRQWAARRPHVQLRTDRYGNLLLQRRGARSKSALIFTAHLDHPAFVVTAADGRTVEAEFRGGVHDDYFPGSPVRWFPSPRSRQPAGRGAITQFRPPVDGGFKTVTVTLDAEPKSPRPAPAPGDLLTWDLPPAEVRGERLHAPACDDLAAAAAMFAAFDLWLKSPTTTARATAKAEQTSGGGGSSGGGSGGSSGGDVRLLCTRAEEIGFVGAIGACRSGLIPRAARLVALENSKSFADSPLGAGPIVRVGDRSSTFDPALTHAVGHAAQQLAAADPHFRYQRKLMAGGTCEASAFQALGHTATCLCLPLANYHNMDEATRRIAPESVHLADYHGLIDLLLTLARNLPTDHHTLPDRLNALFEQHRQLLR